MADKSKIEWCDHTFNPWEGCQKVSPGCDNCYAEARDKWLHGGKHWGPRAKRRRTSMDNWAKPRRWSREATQMGIIPSVFCGSVCDVFDNAVHDVWRNDLWANIFLSPNLLWLLLTKRPENIHARLPRDWDLDGHYPHVWLGTSVEDRARLHRIDTLRHIPAAGRFLSIEPLLEDLGEIDLTGISWVIIGGESGPGARPMHIAWARSVIGQCKAAGVPVFMKQMGAWRPLDHDGQWPWPSSWMILTREGGLDIPDHRYPDPDLGETAVAKTRSHNADPDEWPEDLRVREMPVISNQRSE